MLIWLGEGGSVLRSYRYQGRLRQWIAAAATLALSFQLLLSSVAIGHLTAWQAGTGDTFVICHGVGSSLVDQDGPAKQPDDSSHCVLCTLTSSECAVLPTASAIVTFAPGASSHYLSRHDAQVSEYHSPTGRFQRGPPPHTLVAG
jgi:hypothetical protein